MLAMAFVETEKVVELGNMVHVGAGLWKCDNCQVWWGSHIDSATDAHDLLSMAEPNTNIFLWDEFRGWREKANEANICPECGRVMLFPRFGLFSQASGPETQLIVKVVQTD